MKPEVEELLDKARRSIKTAQKIFKDSEVDFAGSRAFYALFYVAEALLLDCGLAFSSHSTVPNGVSVQPSQVSRVEGKK